jgi:hypothetical protein
MILSGKLPEGMSFQRDEYARQIGVSVGVA